MALYTYDEEADALYVLFAPEPEAAIERTQELGERLHVDEDANGLPVGVEIPLPEPGGCGSRASSGPLRPGPEGPVPVRGVSRATFRIARNPEEDSKLPYLSCPSTGPRGEGTRQVATCLPRVLPSIRGPLAKRTNCHRAFCPMVLRPAFRRR
jgi:uncharacterized protein YuzE